ncbi:hypothetical protein MKY95_07660 [Paenibacillus sp. FSL P4-0176]|uniref:hypothetical protein n=1 Tax=Paenibacillus sp. FSL P4-0176 TaxID=2921631 RepID=UPI0030D08681
MGIQDVAPAFRNPPTFQDLEEVKSYLKDNINKIARSLQDIDFMINGTLDVNNIRAEGIEARSIKAEAITTDKLQAGAVTADKITVGELSAISANLGHIVAGLIESVEIFGAYIATRRNAFPRCEMSATGNVFGAYNDANNHIVIEPNYGGSPAIRFTVASTPRGRIHNLIGYPIFESDSALGLQAAGAIYVNAAQMNFTNWDKLYADNPGRTLGDELREIFDRIEALEGG